MNMKKILIIISISTVIIFSGIFLLLRDTNKKTEEQFQNSLLPDVSASVGEKFELEQGQRAVIENTLVSIRYTGAITTPPFVEPVYDFIYNGSSGSYTSSPYNVSVISGSNGSRSAVFNISSVASECGSESQGEADLCWVDLAWRTGDMTFCENIVSVILKDSCTNADLLADARDTFFTTISIVAIPVITPASVADTVRQMCQGITYTSGICLIVGEETVLTPQECIDLVEGGEYLGTEFYEDCFSVSMYVYGPDEEICTQLEDPELMESCLISVEQAQT
jgi:hypothetical protein